MKTLEKIERMNQLDQFIRLKASGTPKELAQKMRISERLLYYYLKDLKEMGAPIYFNRNRSCYCYSEDIKFEFNYKIISNPN